METLEKYKDCKKEDVIRKVPEDLWCDWLAQASDEVSAVVLALTLLIACLIGFSMKKTVADPINAIAKTAMTYVQDKKNGIDSSGHFSSLGIHTGDELENLTNVMADMEQELIEHED